MSEDMVEKGLGRESDLSLIHILSNQGEYSDLSFKTDMVAEQGVTVIATY